MASSRRFPGPPPKLLGRGVSAFLVNLSDWLYKLWLAWADGIPPGFNDVDPDTIQAGVDADPGTELEGWAAADHQHPVETATPSNPTGPAAAEGTGSALMRADATVQQGIVTTKGDILGYSTVPARIPVGLDGQRLTADSAAALGVSWGPVVVIPAQITANVNDYAPGRADIYYLSSDAARDITGLVAGANGDMRWAINVGSFTISLPHADTGSSAANRIISPGAVPLVLDPGDLALLIYDGPRARWRAYELVGGVEAVGADPGWVEFWGPPYYSQAPG